MADNRQINGITYNIAELVDNAITSADNMELDLSAARKSLSILGNNNPSDTLVIKFSRETAILKILSRETGANFDGQIGKIDFSSRDRAVAGVNSYLNRRISGQHQRWLGRK